MDPRLRGGDVGAMHCHQFLRSYGGEGKKSVTLSLVNKLWAQNNYPIEDPFLEILAEHYDSGVALLDFMGDSDGARVVINDWVADQTHQKIEDLIPPGAITGDTRVVLTNALYFYGSWAYLFETDDTSDEEFTPLTGDPITVPMMYQKEDLSYAEGDGYQVVDLPYDGEKLYMTVVLPEAGRFTEIRDAVDAAWLENAASDASVVEVAVKLPRFEFTYGSLSLKAVLKSLGMTDAFTATADFTGINKDRDLYISDVIHKAFIGVDEYGTEAAAATAVIFDAIAIVGPTVPFTADRPFLFFIRDSSGLVLFSGQLLDPSV